MKLTELKGLIESGELNVGEEMERERMEMVESWMDDGDWEYDRIGLVEFEGSLWLVDIENVEESEGWYGKIREGLSEEDVEKKGLECGVLINVDWGYKDKEVRMRMDSDDDEWEMFMKVVCD